METNQNPKNEVKKGRLKNPGLLVVLCVILLAVAYAILKQAEAIEKEADAQLGAALQKVGRHHKPLHDKQVVSPKSATK